MDVRKIYFEVLLRAAIKASSIGIKTTFFKHKNSWDAKFAVSEVSKLTAPQAPENLWFEHSNQRETNQTNFGFCQVAARTHKTCFSFLICCRFLN